MGKITGSVFPIFALLGFILIAGCASVQPINPYEKYFDDNASSFVKIGIGSYQEAVSALDISQAYVDSHKGEHFIAGKAYCGNKKLGFGSYAVVATNSTDGNPTTLNSIGEIRRYFSPVNDFGKAAAYALLELDNADYNSIYALNLGNDYLVKLREEPSACDCGAVNTKELDYAVSENGSVSLVKTRILSTTYHDTCIN